MLEKLVFRKMQESDRKVVTEMIRSLYQTLKAPDDYITDKKLSATFEQLQANSPFVEIEVFEIEEKIVGYALLFRFWYNEYGGMVLNIDELFVRPEYRSMGIASHYLSTLSARKTDHVALSLEVLPENKGAHVLYKRIGFEEKETITLHKILI